MSLENRAFELSLISRTIPPFMVDFAKMVEIVRFAFSAWNWCEASSDSESSMFGVRGEVFSNFL
jgi:hypothetical protein